MIVLQLLRLLSFSLLVMTTGMMVMCYVTELYGDALVFLLFCLIHCANISRCSDEIKKLSDLAEKN